MYGFFKHWRKDANGAVAVEFGLIFVPFILLVLGIIELALMYTAATMLEGSTHAAARVLRTGQAQESGDALTFFQDTLCNHLMGLVDCNGVVHEVLLSPDGHFSSLDVTPQFDEDGNMISRGFDPGQENSAIIVRSTYRYQFITPLIGTLVSGRADNSVTLMSTVSLRNEPYDF